MKKLISSNLYVYVYPYKTIMTISLQTHTDNTVEEFYMEHNYGYYNDSEYYKTYNFKTTEPELPEWYNTDRDNEIVKEFINEYDVFYDTNKSVETEIREYEAYYNEYKNEDPNDSSSESDDEWSIS